MSGRRERLKRAAKYAAERVLTLPLYAGLERKEIEKICALILMK